MSKPALRTELQTWLDGLVGRVPSVSALVVEAGEVRFSHTTGNAVVEPAKRVATATTLYDLASLTKPLVTALLTLRLAEEGVVPLDLPVARQFAGMCPGPKGRVTILDLLTHRAGFAAWAAVYREVRRPVLGDYAEWVASHPLAYDPGTDVLYSDLGYLMLGAALERHTGRSFQELAQRHILEEVGMEGLALPPSARDRESTAATERGNAFERQLAGADPDASGFREGLIWGQVHDGNAFALGGVAPHAGLFGTTAGVARLAAQFLPGSKLLGAGARQLAAADLTPFARSRRTAGFELAAGPATAATDVLPPESYGHTGFTGTSVWIEPGRQRIYVLLTNRVHPTVTDLNMNALRREFHLRARAVA